MKERARHWPERRQAQSWKVRSQRRRSRREHRRRELEPVQRVLYGAGIWSAGAEREILEIDVPAVEVVEAGAAGLAPKSEGAAGGAAEKWLVSRRQWMLRRRKKTHQRAGWKLRQHQRAWHRTTTAS